MPDPKLAAWRSQATIDAEEAEREAKRQRLANLKTDTVRQDMIDRLLSASPAEISSYVDNNVTDLPTARTMFKRILLLLAVSIKE